MKGNHRFPTCCVLLSHPTKLNPPARGTGDRTCVTCWIAPARVWEGAPERRPRAGSPGEECGETWKLPDVGRHANQQLRGHTDNLLIATAPAALSGQGLGIARRSWKE